MIIPDGLPMVSDLISWSVARCWLFSVWATCFWSSDSSDILSPSIYSVMTTKESSKSMERLHHEGSGLGRGLMQLKVVNMAMYDPCQPMTLDTVNRSSGILFFGHLGSMPLGVDQEVNSSIQLLPWRSYIAWLTTQQDRVVDRAYSISKLLIWPLPTIDSWTMSSWAQRKASMPIQLCPPQHPTPLRILVTKKEVYVQSHLT